MVFVGSVLIVFPLIAIPFSALTVLVGWQSNL